MRDRQIHILEELKRMGEWVLTGDLALRVGCSERTVRTELKTLSEMEGVSLESVRGKGIRLVYWNPIPTRTGEISPEERVRRMEIDLLLSKSMESSELMERYFISESTLRNDLQYMERHLSAYQQILKRRPLRVEGVERLRRVALLNRLRGHAVSNWFAYEDILFVRQMIDELQRILEQPFSDVSFERLNWQLLVQLKRLRMCGLIHLSEHAVEIANDTGVYRELKKIEARYQNQLALRLPSSEKNYLILCLAAAQDTLSDPRDKLLERLKSAVHKFAVSVLSSIYGGALRKDMYEGLLMHFRSFAYQSLLGQFAENPLLDQIKSRYAPTYAAVLLHAPLLEDILGSQLPESEAAYLTIHFQTVLERSVRTNQPRVLIACSFGVGMSQLLAARIETQFGQSIKIIGSCKVREINERFKKEAPDAVISTIPLENSNILHIVITPFLTEEDVKGIREMLGMDSSKSFELLSTLIHSVIFLDEALSRERALARMMIAAEIDEDYAETVYQREHAGSTSIGAGIAIPHGNPEKAKKNQINVLILKRPTLWGTDEVRIVFLLQFRNQDNVLLKKLFEEIAKLSEAPELVHQLTHSETEVEFRSVLSHF
ncbi:BglG family transcription antiterminator [Peribacillus muralis]|uniref:BglG family transcription antiterminator n=1 Tax=Peribacillus muralis TaxID=264697 RepID=UPI00070EC001|nr:PTS sugar transporter subunit IIA [Peribacillus muralis]